MSQGDDVAGPEGAETVYLSQAAKDPRSQRLLEFVRQRRPSKRGFALLFALGAIAWVSAGIYRVQPDEQGIVLRFGRWVDTQQPGLHYHWPFPIDTILLPKTTVVNQLRLGHSDGDRRSDTGTQILTGDENIVEAEYVVLWKIRDAGQFLFRNADSEDMLKTAAEGVIREVIGRNPIQSALSDRRQQIAEQAQAALQRQLDFYHAGIQVTQVQLQRIEPPLAVIDAFNDVQRARADQERARNEAESYRNDILPRARGEAEHITQEAEAYKTQVVDLAQGETISFMSAYQIYKKAPDVIGWRNYLDSMDEVFRKAGKIVIASQGKGAPGIVPYLALTEQRAKAPTAPSGEGK